MDGSEALRELEDLPGPGLKHQAGGTWVIESRAN